MEMDYISQINMINAQNTKKTGKAQLSLVRTFGCQMNAHDSEKIQTMLDKMGYEKAGSEKEADLVLYNTCCVRENAENRVYGNLGLLGFYKKERPSMKIVLCGCMMQREDSLQKISSSYRQVDIIFGTFNLSRFPELLFENIITGKQIIDVRKNLEKLDLEIDSTSAVRPFKFKSSVNIMYGCDNYCSYCIVPYVRGRERSRSVNSIMQEISGMAHDGVLEIMLLGQNVNSYNSDGIKFAELLSRVCKIDGVERIRFMTSHPKDLSDDIIEVMQREPKICKHLHLPVQSGSTNILNKMNRKYSRDDYFKLVSRVRSAITNLALTTDIIVGFPGETEEDFEATLELVKRIRFSGAYTFLYSKRSGTPAAEMEAQVSEKVSQERFDRLLLVLNKIFLEENEKLVGKILSVLPEEKNTRHNGFLTGRADNNIIVHFKADENRIGVLTDVKITDCKTFYLLGECVYADN